MSALKSHLRVRAEQADNVREKAKTLGRNHTFVHFRFLLSDNPIFDNLMINRA